MDIDFLIVGQGLAGSLLAWELIQRQCKVLIVDNGKNNASQVAAGLINPITGIRFAKSPQVDTDLPVAKNCYSRLSTFFHEDFYFEKAMLRIFRSTDELNSCQKRLQQADYSDYLGDLIPYGDWSTLIATPFGYLEQKQTGYLSTQPLLSHLKKFFIARNAYKQLEFNNQAIQVSPFLCWQEIKPKQIIYCEGYLAGVNPWFSWLPLQPVKGEILTLEHQSALPDRILNYGNWLIPLNNQQIRIGASFQRNCVSTKTTSQARRSLTAAFKAILPFVETELSNQQAGIRPCTQDRQPLIGWHPKYPQLAIFNGFGAKGSLLIPWYAQHFAEALLTQSTLLETANIKRYEALFPG